MNKDKIVKKILYYIEKYLKPFLFSRSDGERIKVSYFWSTVILTLFVLLVILFGICVIAAVFYGYAKQVEMVGLGTIAAVIATMAGLVTALIALYNQSKKHDSDSN
jgi:NAD/NADP transhydrogenase beta subunit